MDGIKETGTTLKYQKSEELLKNAVLDQHMIAHTAGDDRHQRDTCAKKLNWKKDHVNSQEQPYKHLECDDKASVLIDCLDKNKSAAQNYQKKSYKCNQCGWQCNRKAELTRHLNTKHIDESRNKCTLCGKRYQWRRNFVRHMRAHDVKALISRQQATTPQQRDEDVDRPEEEEIVELTCLLCGKKSRLKSSLIGRFRPPTSRFICHLCDEDYNLDCPNDLDLNFKMAGIIMKTL